MIKDVCEVVKSRLLRQEIAGFSWQEVQGEVQALKRSIPRNGHEPTLEVVFLEITGSRLVEEEEIR